MQISGHLALHELIEINAVILWPCCQEWPSGTFLWQVDQGKHAANVAFAIVRQTAVPSVQRN
jgi:hypothetical protein